MAGAFVLIDQLAFGATDNGAKKNDATVVIHVGPHKTGSTTVQHELAKSVSLLEDDGWTLLLGNQFGKLTGDDTDVTNVVACYAGLPKVSHWLGRYVENQTETCVDVGLHCATQGYQKESCDV